MDNPWCSAPEEEYLAYLEGERHMYAWCLVEHGARAPADAEREALAAYLYEPPTDDARGLLFHELAWHFAMLALFGDRYWTKRRDLERASDAYKAESARFEAARRASSA